MRLLAEEIAVSQITAGSLKWETTGHYQSSQFLTYKKVNLWVFAEMNATVFIDSYIEPRKKIATKQ